MKDIVPFPGPERTQAEVGSEGVKMLTTSEVAERWSMSEELVRRLVRRGELAAHRIANRLRFHPRDVRAYEESNRTGGTR